MLHLTHTHVILHKSFQKSLKNSITYIYLFIAQLCQNIKVLSNLPTKPLFVRTRTSTQFRQKLSHTGILRVCVAYTGWNSDSYRPRKITAQGARLSNLIVYFHSALRSGLSFTHHSALLFRNIVYRTFDKYRKELIPVNFTTFVRVLSSNLKIISFSSQRGKLTRTCYGYLFANEEKKKSTVGNSPLLLHEFVVKYITRTRSSALRRVPKSTISIRKWNQVHNFTHIFIIYKHRYYLYNGHST